jgi:hypothetical protein
VPVEAQACGRPAIALAEGGALDSIVDGVTGILVEDRSVEAFADALNEASRRAFDPIAIRRHAESFGKERFQREFQDLVNSVSRSSNGDDRDVSRGRSNDSDEESNAARYAQRRSNMAGRERVSQRSTQDDRDVSRGRSNDSDEESNAARYAQRRGTVADRENEK